MHITAGRADLARILGDIALGLTLAATILFTAAALAQSWGGAAWVLGMCTATLVGALALLRRKHRFVAALVGHGVAVVAVVVAAISGLPDEPAPATTLALAVLLASAVRRLPARQAAAVAASGLVVVLGAWLAATPPAHVAVVPSLSVVAWLGAVATGLLGRLLAARREAEVERVRHDERLTIARELHDVVAHHVTGMVVQAQAAQIVLGRAPAAPGQDVLAGSLAGIESAGSDALTSLRRVVGLLRAEEDSSPTTPGIEDLTVLVDRFASGGPRVDLRLPDDAVRWRPEVATTVYRVVQESLTNVRRHAVRARSVSVAVDSLPGSVRVEVSDDAPHTLTRPGHGSGHHPGSGPGYGLVGMRERVEALGGTLESGPRPSGGWAVVATLPSAPASIERADGREVR